MADLTSSASLNSLPPSCHPSRFNPYDLEAARIDRYLDETPPEQRFLVEEFLPENVVGIFAGAGGTGKSMVALQLAISVATGWPWLGKTVGQPKSVLFISAEDGPETFHHRLPSILNAIERDLDQADKARWSEALSGLRDRIYVPILVGSDARLVDGADRTQTDSVDQIIEMVKGLSDVGLVILDPLARFDDGGELDGRTATKLIASAERIRQETKATVLFVHHVSQAYRQEAYKGRHEEFDPSTALRGVTQLVDGVRWASVMAPMGVREAKAFGVAPEERADYLQIAVAKSNYFKPPSKIWVQKRPNGVLSATDLEKSLREEKEQAEKAHHAEIVLKVQELILRKGPMSQRTISDRWGGISGPLGVGQKRLREALKRAIVDGDLVERRLVGKPHKVVALPGEPAG